MEKIRNRGAGGGLCLAIPKMTSTKPLYVLSLGGGILNPGSNKNLSVTVFWTGSLNKFFC